MRLHADGVLERHQDRYYPIAPDLAEVRDRCELRITREMRGVARLFERATTLR